MPQKKIQPTNILLKNRLYNLCYKFYRTFIQYEDKIELENDFRLYYYYTILKVFQKKAFRLIATKKNCITSSHSHLTFQFQDYNICLSFDEKPGICLEISLQTNRMQNVQWFKHQLLLDISRNIKEAKEIRTDAITTHIVSIWNLVNAIDLKEIFMNHVSEKEMMTFWIENLFNESIAKKEVYTKYCPICKSKNIENQDSVYTCFNCHSMYTFKPNEEKDTIWFINLRR
mgnify:FL=1